MITYSTQCEGAWINAVLIVMRPLPLQLPQRERILRRVSVAEGMPCRAVISKLFFSTL